MPASALRVLLADRPGPARQVLARLVSELPGVVLAAESGDAAGLRSAVRDARPDVLLIDDRLLDGWHGPYDARLRLVALGMEDRLAYRARARRLGAVAWLPKEHAAELLPDVLANLREDSAG